MHVYARSVFLHVFAAWVLTGALFLIPQPVPAPEGVTVTARGFPLQFYATGTSAFAGAIPAQVSIGFLLLDFIFWLLIVAFVHFFYRRFLSGK